MKDADAFYQRLSSRMERRYLVDASQTEKERKRLEARNQEIDGMFLNLYTDKAKGILTEPVSYTHLDVYKRQPPSQAQPACAEILH